MRAAGQALHPGTNSPTAHQGPRDSGDFKEMFLLITESPRATAHGLNPWAGLVARPYQLPVALQGFPKMKPGVGWQRGPDWEDPGPLGLCVVPAVASRHQLQSGMLLEGNGQESGCCLIQKPAKFPSAGLDQGGGERVFLLVLQNALCGEGRSMGPCPHPRTLGPLLPSRGDIAHPGSPNFKQSGGMGSLPFYHVTV